MAEQASPPREPDGYDAVLSFGGAMHVDQEDRHPWLRKEKALLAELLERRVPLLGVCLGAQLLAEAAGAPAAPRERAGDRLARGRADRGGCGRSACSAPLGPALRGLRVAQLRVPASPGATPLATQRRRAFRPTASGTSAWGIQFHAEVTTDDVEAWIDDYRGRRGRGSHRPRPGRATTADRGARSAAWNELGRGLCERFLAAAATRA